MIIVMGQAFVKYKQNIDISVKTQLPIKLLGKYKVGFSPHSFLVAYYLQRI